MQTVGVALLGFGNVGAGVVRLLRENAVAIESRLGARVHIAGIAVRDPQRERLVDIESDLLTTDADSLIAREDVDIVCEVIGGIDRAGDLVLAAIGKGKQVVTANKALLAERGKELVAAAGGAGVDLFYEAAVCGGVPVIRALREGLASDRIVELTGIVNGTSNYIATEMSCSSRSFDEVLRDAQAKGYAEADPTLDVGGGDAAHKLAILAMLAFGVQVEVESIHVEGIDALEAIDYRMAREFGYVIKPLAVGSDHGDAISLRVHPALLPSSWLLADVPGAMNALYVRSDALGPSMYYGAGAGMMPTAMAVVSDVIEVSRNLLAGSAGSFPVTSRQKLEERQIRPLGELISRHYLRFGVVDRPGVLGQLTTILGDHGVSISDFVQRASGAADRGAEVVALTHPCRDQAVTGAIAEIEALDTVSSRAVRLRIAGSTE